MLWWEMTNDEVLADPVARMDRQLAYASIPAEVLCDIREMCYTLGDSDNQQIALIALYQEIRYRSGGATKQAELDMIKAERQSATHFSTSDDEIDSDNLEIG
jgi:hypothetical protein